MKGRVTGFCLFIVCVVLVGTSWGTDTDNTFYGNLAGESNDGSSNSFFGASAGRFNSGSHSSFFGYGAGILNRGAGNSFFGDSAGVSNHNGSNNSFFGYNAGYNNSGDPLSTGSGQYNSFFGASAGYQNDIGFGNNFYGFNAGHNNTKGSNNSYFGQNSGVTNTEGNNNTFIGTSSGTFTVGSGNVFIGAGAGYTVAAADNTLIIDNCINGAPCDAPFIIGDFSAHYLTVSGTVNVTSTVSVSDERYKRNIQPLQLSLDKVTHLTGVSYEWKTVEYKGKGFKEGRQIGLIAQDVEKVFPELVQTDDKGYKAVAYDKLVPVLIEAMKEQQKVIADLNKKLSQALKMMEQRLAAMESPAKTVALK